MSSRTRARSRAFSSMLLVAALGAASAFAQSPLGPRALPPPSYGAPTSPLLTGYGSRSMTPLSLGLSVAVSVDDLQKLLPPGFTPLALATDPTRASVSLSLNHQTSTEITATGPAPPGTYGPFNTLAISTVVRNSLGQNQVFTLATFANNQEIVDINNSGQGAVTNRFADISFTVKDADGLMTVHAVARDPDTGLVVNVIANAPPQVTAQARNIGPFVSTTIVLGNPATIAAAAFVGLSSDSASVPVLPGSLDVQNIRLKFVSGKVAVDPVPLSATISWNTEGFFKRLN